MNREKVASLTWLLVALAIVYGSTFYNYGSWSNPGPSFLPLWCGIVMAVLSSITFIQSLREDKKETRTKSKNSFLTPRWPKLLIVTSILIGFAVLLETLGFITITFITMLILLKTVGEIRWRIAFVEAGLATITSYTLFEIWLNVPLPPGFLRRFF